MHDDSLEIMTWYKEETSDKHNKKIFVDIVGGEDVTYGRLNDNF